VPPSGTIVSRFCPSRSARNRTVVQIRNTHLGPVDVPGLNIDYYAIGVSALCYDDLLVGAVRIRENTTTAQIQNESAAEGSCALCCGRFWFGDFCVSHVFSCLVVRVTLPVLVIDCS
jgi:hypothetical protein